jgi:hypothetical protein
MGNVTFQGELRYDIVGNVPAPYFFHIDHNTGLIGVKADLRKDKAFQYTVSNKHFLIPFFTW